MPINFHALETQLISELGSHFAIDSTSRVSGGSICEAYKIKSGSTLYFLKTHQVPMYSMLVNESKNLHSLAATNTIRVPMPLTHGIIDSSSYLLLEHLKLQNSGSHARLGESLANLHQNNGEHFGWEQDNWIGATPQSNDKNSDWLAFWRKNRLGYQLNLAKNNSAPHSLIEICERLFDDFDPLFQNYSPVPSLLHGDLWCGNFGFIKNDIPVVFDPACYFGDRETDIAMTMLFNGFDQEFYRAYDNHHPLDSGFQTRKNFYNLYHLLNHFNLFSGAYASQAEQLCLKVLSAIK